MLWQTTTATLMAAGVGLAAFPAFGQNAEQRSQPPTVAIMDFTNSSLVDHDAYDPFSAGIAGLLLADLSRNPDIEVIERERLREILDEIELSESGRVDSMTAVQAGKILGAQHIIFGVFVIDGRGTLRLDARAVNVETSRVEHVETVTDDADNLLRAVRQLGTQLSDGLQFPEARGSAKPEPAREGQVLANLKYARALLAEDRDDTPGAVGFYREFLADTPEDYAPELRRMVERRIQLLTSARD